jgi:hypothetical protein
MSDEHPHVSEGGLTRRQTLQAGAAVALGSGVLGRPGAARGAPVGATLAGTAPVVAAMHVHAVYSEGAGSWEQQYANCVAAGADVLFQTDHDFRARALNYMGLLNGTFLGSTTGAWRQHVATFSAAGPVRLLIESAGTTPATQSLVMEENPTAWNRFRTGIDGQTITHAFGASRLDPGASYEVVLTLSLHPAQGGRPAGQYSLRYRFQPNATAARFTEAGGLVGVVRAPLPANGATVTLNPQTDIAAIWPTMLAIDHCSFLLSFVVTSPRSGVVADVNLRSVTVNRVRHDAAGVLAAQQRIASTYSPRYGIAGYVSEEVSMGPEPPEHCNSFGSTPEYALKANITPSNWQPYYRDMIARVHARGGAVSWNHPFGSSAGPLLTPAQQDALRRQVFAQRLADRFLGSDCLEVGYLVRGHMPFEQHVALWDTFSRNAAWLTGTGASDDHSGHAWPSLTNGFLTGTWAASTSAGDLVSALAGGRAYTFHPGRTPGLQLDTLVGGRIPMGKAAIVSQGSLSMAISVVNLPTGCTVQLVRGPVDLAGQDPATTVVATFPRSSFPASGTGTVTTTINTSTSCFVRPQVRLNGVLVATGNPTWLLRTPPPAGIPAARAA